MEPEMLVHEIFATRKHVADALIDQILKTVRTNLESRGKADRDQGKDDMLFSEVTSVLVEAATAGEFQLAIDVSKRCCALAQNYELSTGGQIHKGAITFNLALMYLAIDDFTAAMRYFEIAEAETRASQQQADPNKADSTFDLFRTFDLFDRNFWHDIDRKAAAHPLPVYRTLWGIDFGSGAAKDDSKKLSYNSTLLYLIALARRMRYHQLAKETTWVGANSLHLAHWNLSADLGRLLETEMKKRCPPPPLGARKPTLLSLLLQCFHHTTKPVDLSKLQEDLHKVHKVSDSSTFDAAFPILRNEIECGTRDVRIANAVYLLGATRNQVAHGVDDSIVLFKDPSAAAFTVDVLLSLCHVEGWTN
jgi:hypothetical protein